MRDEILRDKTLPADSHTELSLFCRSAVYFADSGAVRIPREAASASVRCDLGSAGLLLGQAGASKPRSFLCALQLRGRSSGRVERACAVSSGGCCPRAISSMIDGARKANRMIRLT